MKTFNDLAPAFNIGATITDVARWYIDPLGEHCIRLTPIIVGYVECDRNTNWANDMVHVTKNINDTYHVAAYKSLASHPFEECTVTGDTVISIVLHQLFPDHQQLPPTKVDPADVRGVPSAPTREALGALLMKAVETLSGNPDAVTAQALLESGNPLSDVDFDFIADNLELCIDDLCKIAILNLMHNFTGMTYAECARDLYEDYCTQLKELAVFPEKSVDDICRLAEMLKVFATLSKPETE